MKSFIEALIVFFIAVVFSYLIAEGFEKQGRIDDQIYRAPVQHTQF